jgi:hypothetical protein
MSYQLKLIFYMIALVAAALVTFGPWGAIVAILILAFWAWAGRDKNRRFIPLYLMLLLAAIVVVFSLVNSAGRSRSEAQSRLLRLNQLQQVSRALLAYENANGRLPPAYVADANGKLMHSWRVLILPYLGETALFQQYNLAEPWDGPNNSKLAAQIPAAYREQSGGATDSNTFAIVDDEAAWTGNVGRTLASITDGLSSTILCIEASGLGIHWMSPQDVSLDEGVEILTQRKSGHTQTIDQFLTSKHITSRFVFYCDGSGRVTGQLNDAKIARAALTAAGGEFVPADLGWSTTTTVHWARVYSLFLFSAISILPLASRRPRGQITSEMSEATLT